MRCRRMTLIVVAVVFMAKSSELPSERKRLWWWLSR
jgi:hypothetical protein